MAGRPLYTKILGHRINKLYTRSLLSISNLICSMRPTRIHYFYAQNWPLKLWFCFAILLTTIIVLTLSDLTITALQNWRAVARLFAILVLGPLIGFFVGLLFSSLIVSPLYFSQLEKNGGPFQIGDQVEILVKPHRGRIVRVYALGQGYSVRVELGAAEREKFKDFFSGTALLLKTRNSVLGS